MARVVQVVAGAALIAASFFVPGAGLFGVKLLSGALVFGIGTSIAFGGTVSLFAKRPKISSQLGSAALTVRNPIAPRRTIYGQVRTGGVITYIAVAGPQNEQLQIVITLAAHEVQEISRMYLDGVGMNFDASDVSTADDNGTNYQGKIFWEKNLGTAAQTVFPSLPADSGGKWTSAHRQRSCAGVYLRIQYDRTLFANGIPNFTFDIKGKKVYDPRTPATAYSRNWALCFADFLTADLGMRADYATRIDETALIAAANVSDESVNLAGNIGFGGVGVDDLTVDASGYSGGTNPQTLELKIDSVGTPDTFAYRYGTDEWTYGVSMTGSPQTLTDDVDVDFAATTGHTLDDSWLVRLGTEPRYQVDAIIEAAETPGSVIKDFVAAGAGYLVYIGGRWTILAGAYRSPAVTITDDDILGPITVTSYRSRPDLFNGVKGSYIPFGSATPTDYPTEQGPVYLAEDQNERFWRNADFRFVSSPSTCLRIARVELRRNRRQQSAQFLMKIGGYRLQPGDTVQLTLSKFGFTAKVFEVAAVMLTLQQDENDNSYPAIDLSLRECDSDVYEWEPSDEDVRPPQTDLIVAARQIPGPAQPWQPFYEPATFFVPEETFRDVSEYTFGIGANYEEQGDGTAHATIVVNGYPPVNRQSRTLPRPSVPATASNQTTGGELRGDRVYYWQLMAKSADGWGALSRIIVADVPAGTDTNRVTISDLSWPVGTTDWMLFGGLSPDAMTSQAQGSGYSPSPTFFTVTGSATKPSAITINGDSALPQSISALQAAVPDPDADHIRFSVRRIAHGGIAGTSVLSVASGTVTVDQFGGTWVGNEFADRFAMLVADFDAATISRADFKIQSNNTAGVLTIYAGQPSTIAQLGVGDVLLINSQVTALSATYIEDSLIVNPYYPSGMTVDAEVGRILRFITGARRGEAFAIESNTSTKLYLVGGVPDDVVVGDSFIIEYPTVDSETLSAPAAVTDYLTPSSWSIPVPNIKDQLLHIIPMMVNKDGLEHAEDRAPMRMIWIYSDPLNLTPDNSNITDYVEAAPDSNQAAILGGIVHPTTGGGVAGFYMPFNTQGGSQEGRSERFPMPVGGRVFNTKLFQRTTETAASLVRLGIDRNGTQTSEGVVSWAFTLPSLSAGPAVYGNGNERVRFERGDSLRFDVQSGGAAPVAGYTAWAACYEADSGVHPLGLWASGFTTGGTQYHGLGDPNETTEDDCLIVLPAGTLKWMTVQIIGAQPASMTSAFTVRKNKGDTALAATVTAAAATGAVFMDFDDEVTFNGTSDTFSLQEVVAGGAGSCAIAIITLGFLPDDLGVAIIPFNGGGPMPTVASWTAPWDLWTGLSVEGLCGFPMPRGGTLDPNDCILYLKTAKGAGQTTTVRLRINGADSEIQWSLTDATPTGAVVANSGSPAFTITVEEGDYIDLQVSGSDTSGFISSERLLLRPVV